MRVRVGLCALDSGYARSSPFMRARVRLCALDSGYARSIPFMRARNKKSCGARHHSFFIINMFRFHAILYLCFHQSLLKRESWSNYHNQRIPLLLLLIVLLGYFVLIYIILLQELVMEFLNNVYTLSFACHNE